MWVKNQFVILVSNIWNYKREHAHICMQMCNYKHYYNMCTVCGTHMWNFANFNPTVQAVLFLPACLNAPITISPNSYNINEHVLVYVTNG